MFRSGSIWCIFGVLTDWDGIHGVRWRRGVRGDDGLVTHVDDSAPAGPDHDAPGPATAPPTRNPTAPTHDAPGPATTTHDAPHRAAHPGTPAAAHDPESPEVTTPLGTLRGVREDGLLRFRGVRFATAGRFEPPRPVTPWEGTRDALAEGAMCPQPPFTLALLALPKPIRPMDEDCFFLNITAPDAPSEALRPVMVWIHGGSYVNGSGGGGIYDPARLVRDGDVIVVGINYRLGAFGFLALEGVAPGNLGIQDQLVALEWVRNNIESFGGDAQNVTLFGQSAGADAIANLIAIPEADHLFARAILQSAPLGLHGNRDAVARQLGANFLAALAATVEGDTRDTTVERGPRDRALTLDPGEAAVDAGQGARALNPNPANAAIVGHQRDIAVERAQRDATPNNTPDPRTATVDQMLAAQVAAMSPLAGDPFTAGMPYAPIADAWPVPPTNDVVARRTRRAGSLSVLVGYNRDDFSPFLEGVGVLRRARASAVLRPLTEPLCALLTRRVFGAPALDLARQLRNGGADVATYRFDWRPTGTPWGACHCIELPFFWGDEEFWRGSPMLAGVEWSDLEEFGRGLRRDWAAFARGGSAALGWAASGGGVDRRITFAPRYADR